MSQEMKSDGELLSKGAFINRIDGGFAVNIALRPGEVYYLVCAQSPTSVEHAHKLSENGSEMVLIERVKEIATIAQQVNCACGKPATWSYQPLASDSAIGLCSKHPECLKGDHEQQRVPLAQDPQR